MRRRALVIPFALALMLSCAVVFSPHAPLDAQVRGTDALSVQVSPEVPAPGAQTTISITSMTIDLSTATIAWSIDGTGQVSAAGERSFTFTMGPAGRTTAVTVSVTPQNGPRVTRTFTFRPASVLLLWEADTYTPPLYRGQALYSPGAGVRVLAIPSITDASGALIPTSELNFRWQLEGEAYADRSGTGRDLLLLTGSQMRAQEQVGVTVLRRDGSKAAEAAILIPATQPMLHFYKADPLRGTRWERALIGDVQLIDTETSIVAEPYFLAGGKRSSDLVQQWRINGTDAEPSGSDASMITLRQQGATGGSAQLEYSVQSTSLSRLLQTASGALNLILSSGSGSSIF